MNRPDQFLNIAARQMRVMPAAARTDELRGHLQQRAEDYQSAGMSDDAACRLSETTAQRAEAKKAF